MEKKKEVRSVIKFLTLSGKKPHEIKTDLKKQYAESTPCLRQYKNGTTNSKKGGKA